MKINTILLITLDESGEAMALIQSGVMPFPRIIQVSSPGALEEAWNNQKNNEIFYDSVYSIGVNEELSQKMKELGIKDGSYLKAAVKRYRLGNQPETYELREDYLGWLPENHKNWEYFTSKHIKNAELKLVNPEDKTTKTLFLHRFIIKDAFPMSFYGEERSENWSVFAIVSDTQASEKFIIPLY